jgi:hypothetical protein
VNPSVTRERPVFAALPRDKSGLSAFRPFQSRNSYDQVLCPYRTTAAQSSSLTFWKVPVPAAGCPESYVRFRGSRLGRVTASPEIAENAGMFDGQMLEHQYTHGTLRLSMFNMAPAAPARIVPIMKQAGCQCCHVTKARAHMLHGPVRWKCAILGNDYLNGVNPPFQRRAAPMTFGLKSRPRRA